ncbi:hypothetical protein OF83DRAFT_595781 [Amylostereum chailletii]|nr:hypothetical protein OF83DRAFT_595781 [Amylostereum chailletii]
MGARRNHLTAFWIVIESGALYSFSTILALVFYSTKANCGAIMGSILGQLSATVPYLILARTVEFNASSSQNAVFITGPGSSWSEGSHVIRHEIQHRRMVRQI